MLQQNSPTAIDGAETLALTLSPAKLAVSAPVDAPLPMPAQVIVMGDYLVGDAEDAQLGGHPDIRY